MTKEGSCPRLQTEHITVNNKYLTKQLNQIQYWCRFFWSLVDVIRGKRQLIGKQIFHPQDVLCYSDVLHFQSRINIKSRIQFHRIRYSCYTLSLLVIWNRFVYPNSCNSWNHLQDEYDGIYFKNHDPAYGLTYVRFAILGNVVHFATFQYH